MSEDDGITAISLPEAHSQWNAVFELISADPLALRTAQDEPHGFVLYIEARHHKAERGRVRFGLAAEREELVAMAREILATLG